MAMGKWYQSDTSLLDAFVEGRGSSKPNEAVEAGGF
jgi:hypothetical protein